MACGEQHVIQLHWFVWKRLALAFILTSDQFVGIAAVRADSYSDVDNSTAMKYFAQGQSGNETHCSELTGCCEIEDIESAVYWVLAMAIFGFFFHIAARAHRYLQPRVENEGRANMINTQSLGFLDTPKTPSALSEGRLALTWYTIKFKQKQAEEQWHDDAQSTKVKDSAMILFWAGVVAFIYTSLTLGQNLHKHGWRYFTWNCLAIFATLAVVAAARSCSKHPNERLYWSILVFLFFFLPAVQLSPFTASCRAVTSRRSSVKINEWEAELRHFDCSLAGHSSMQILITWILVQPWVIMHLEHIHLVWFWILGVLPGWALLSTWMTRCHVFPMIDLLMRLCLLIIAQTIACIKKYTLEKSRRLKFLQSLDEKSASKKMYSILSLMMPKHVIPTMIKEPDTSIANEIGRVSILFVLITDIGRLVSPKSPSCDLLNFLNNQFTRMDMICAANGVTKIETVAEEYVAAVGVLPDDIEQNKAGHSFLLERLLKAAGEIMCQQTEEVKYKMGIHTGPIYAGVVRGKLPRYRLFGDTINTAARMMQKCERGMLQFGKETAHDVPVNMRTQVHLRGDVEMKGKGMVTTYTYEPERVGIENVPSTPSKKLRQRYAAERKMSIAFQQFAEEWVSESEEADRNFEDTLKGHQMSDPAPAKRLFLREKEGFTHEMEKKWFKWYHETAICHKMSRRCGIQAAIVLVVSGIEFLAFVVDQPGTSWNLSYWKTHARVLQFVYMRLLVLLGCQVLWLLSEAGEWMKAHPNIVQGLLLFNSMANTVAVYISYEALFISNGKEATDIISQMIVKGSKSAQVATDQLLTLNFVLFVFLFMRMHALLFWPSCLFIPVTGGCIFAPAVYKRIPSLKCIWGKSCTFGLQTEEWNSMYSTNGEFFFMMMVFVFVTLAHFEEQHSRLRYKLKHAVETMKENTENIVDKLMPNQVAQKLQESVKGQAFTNNELALSSLSHKFRHATIAQSDLCGFTAFVSNTRKTPKEVMEFLSYIFGKFDELTDTYGVYKVETVGDAYIAGMAEHTLTEDNSPYNVVLFGLDMVRAVDDWARQLKVDVSCRVGIHHDECIGGIVGTDMQRYHLFGDMFSVLEILESTALEGRVQVSEACKCEVERQVKDEPCILRRERVRFIQREGTNLKTSKGVKHEFHEVGGRTFLVTSNKELRHVCAQPSSIVEHEMRKVKK